MTRHFVPLVDAAEGRFENAIAASNQPMPLAPENASSLHEYISSFTQERYDWTTLNEPPCDAEVAPPGIIQYDNLRAKNWRICINGRVSQDSPVLPLIGYTLKPGITALRLYVWTYLLLHPKLRPLQWTIVHRDTGQTVDWSRAEIILDGHYDLILDGDVMIVSYSTSDMHFVPLEVKDDDTHSSVSSCSAPPVRVVTTLRSSVPRRTIHVRDEKCLITGKAVLADFEPGLLGTAKVAHILPFGKPWLIDKLRFALNPYGFGSAAPTELRQLAVNHPSNLMLLASKVEDFYDAFELAIDPLVPGRPSVVHLSSDGRLMTERDVSMFYNPDAPFPELPFGTDSAPGPAPACLLAHLIATLSWCCRHRMVHEHQSADVKELESSRSGEVDTLVSDWRKNIVFEADNYIDADPVNFDHEADYVSSEPNFDIPAPTSPSPSL